MTKAIIKRLQSKWQGPAINLIVGDEKVVLGEGIPKTSLIFKNPATLKKLIFSPSLAFGEGYMSGDIVVEGDLMEVMQGYVQSPRLIPANYSRLKNLRDRLPISVKSGESNAQHHYDIGNNFYALWLDKTRTYTCAYFQDGNETLEQAQIKKLDLICRKLKLKPGHTFLDIGAGWGSLVLHAAEHYGVKATGITPAREQAAYIKAEATKRGLSDRVEVINEDWRQLDGHFDRIASVGMFEHVGRRQYNAFFAKWRRLLADDGISLLHTIATRRYPISNPWMARYIFPGGYLPTLSILASHAARSGLRMYRAENLRPHYAHTLAQWSANFLIARGQVIDMFDEEFSRMWWLYLQSSEAGFRFGELDLWQLELYGPNAPLPLSRAI